MSRFLKQSILPNFIRAATEGDKEGNPEQTSDRPRRQMFVAEAVSLILVASCLIVAMYLVLVPRKHPPVQVLVPTVIHADGQGESRGLLYGRAQKVAFGRIPPDDDTEATNASEPEVTTLHGAGWHKLKDRRCEEKVQFTWCTPDNEEDKYFFRADTGECVARTAVPPPPCLSGANRFRSVHDCKKACFDQPVPQDQCLFPAEFRTCLPKDIVRNWYFVHNGSCRTWGFRGGNCVSPRLPLFRSKEECRVLCLVGRVGDRHPTCSESPVEHVCSPLQMHFPVYAVSRSHHKFSCVTVDPAEPRCIMGLNRFRSWTQCRRTCLA